MSENAMNNRRKWRQYLANRKGVYEFRTLRFWVVYEKLVALGLEDGDLIIDVGAGTCEFDRYLRQTQNFDGQYLPVDAAIDGTELNEWLPKFEAAFFVSIETLEHLDTPSILLEEMPFWASKGVVITTPNPEKTDVLAMCPTHKTPISAEELHELGYDVQERYCFGKDGDTLVAWRKGRFG